MRFKFYLKSPPLFFVLYGSIVSDFLLVLHWYSVGILGCSTGVPGCSVVLPLFRHVLLFQWCSVFHCSMFQSSWLYNMPLKRCTFYYLMLTYWCWYIPRFSRSRRLVQNATKFVFCHGSIIIFKQKVSAHEHFSMLYKNNFPMYNRQNWNSWMSQFC